MKSLISKYARRRNLSYARVPNLQPGARGGWQKFLSFLDSARALVVNLVLIISFGMLALLSYRSLTNTDILIAPIEPTAELAKRGFTGEVIANLFIEKLETIKSEAITMFPRDNFNATFANDEPLDIKIAATGFSLRSLLQSIRRELGTPVNQLSGFISQAGDTLQLHIRYNQNPYFVTKCHISAIDKAMGREAEMLMGQIQPFVLGAYYYAQDEDFLAVDQLRKSLRDINPNDDLWALNLWGLILRKNKMYDAAKERFYKILNRDSTFFRAYSNLAITCGDLRQFDSAYIYYQKSMSLHRTDTTLMAWSKTLRSEGKMEEALTKLNEVRALNDKNIDIPGELARHAFFKTPTDTLQTIRYLHEAIRLKPKESEDLYLLALLYQSVKDHKRAKYYAIAAHTLEPHNLAYLKLILQILIFNSGEHVDEDAIAEYKKKQQAAFYYQLGLIFINAQNERLMYD